MSFHAKQVVTNLKNLVTRNLHVELSRWLKLRLEEKGHEVSMADSKVATSSMLMKTAIFKDVTLDFDSTRSVDLEDEINNRDIEDNDPLHFLMMQRHRYFSTTLGRGRGIRRPQDVRKAHRASLSSITDGFMLLVRTATCIRDLKSSGKYV